MVVGIDRRQHGKESLGGGSAKDGRQLVQPGCGRALGGDLPRLGSKPHGRASAERREPSAAFTKLLPSSHIGPGNLRHSVSTSSSAFTNMSSSFSPMMSGGRIFITSIA